MEISFPMCKTVMDTLPVGFYTGRRIALELDEKMETSCYSPMEDKIIVSYPIIAQRMQSVPDGTCELEEAVRSMLYHEVSHAILTPANAIRNCMQVNVFEDERIETVLKDYYHGVNFKKQLYDLHGGSAPKATNVDSAFFNAVRFGLGTDRVKEKVNEMLEEYKSIDRLSSRWDGHPCVRDYEKDIEELYNMVKKDYRTNPEEFNASDSEGEQQQMDNMKMNRQMNGNSSGKKSDEEQEGEGEGASEPNGEEGESEQKAKMNPHEVSMSEEQLKRMVGRALGKSGKLNGNEQKKLEEFQKTVEMIIGNFNKKNAGGSGINTYSGVFNPRAVARKDYRYFERSMSTRGNNKFGTCHLNLMIDCSGSFCNNVDLTNAILATLSEVERKNRNFTMDVCFINEELHPCKTVRDRTMRASGGNTIPPETKEYLIKMQKPQTCNYNIILFDGDAICEYLPEETSRKMFGIFDMKQTTLITDPDNNKYMEPPFTSTKVVVTQNYTDELIHHITNALTIAFG